jgi:hypothetical protein
MTRILAAAIVSILAINTSASAFDPTDKAATDRVTNVIRSCASTIAAGAATNATVSSYFNTIAAPDVGASALAYAAYALVYRDAYDAAYPHAYGTCAAAAIAAFSR